MLAYLLYAFFGGYAAFLLGLAVFMYRENQKFGDNQFTMKLLPPPPRLAQAPRAESASESAPVSDWSALPVRPVEAAPAAHAAGPLSR